MATVKRTGERCNGSRSGNNDSWGPPFILYIYERTGFLKGVNHVCFQILTDNVMIGGGESTQIYIPLFNRFGRDGPILVNLVGMVDLTRATCFELPFICKWKRQHFFFLPHVWIFPLNVPSGSKSKEI